MGRNKTTRFALLLGLAPALALTACAADEGGSPGDTGSSCAGGKCDDIDPADFACKNLQNLTGRDTDNVLAELNDPFAQLVLKQGEPGCPTTRTQMMERLRATDAEGCDSDARAGLTSFIATETGQLNPGPNNLYRAVTSRRCSGREQHEMVFSIFGARESGLPESVEIMAIDAETKEYNYYTVERGEVAFHGSSTDILKHQAGRCQECHTGGGMIMKELRNPWIHWEAGASTPDARGIVDAHDDLGRKSGGSSMESLTKRGNDVWNETRVTLMTNPDSGFSPKDMLKPLFCGSEFNLDTAATSTSGLRDLPQNLFTHCMLSNTSCEGTHFGESGGVSLDREIYEAAIADAGSTVAQTDADDTIFDLTFVEPAVGDIDYLGRLVDAGAIDQDFIRDVLAVDFTQPVFSDERCELLEFAPEWDDLTAPEPDPEPDTGDTDDGGTSGGDPTDGGTGGGEPNGPGNCCDDRSAAGEFGCENETIESCVCEFDNFCCRGDDAGEGVWDSICVQGAQESCDVVCERNGDIGAAIGAIKEANPETIKAAFIANLEAANPEDGSAAAQLLASLKDTEDADRHASRVGEFLDACRARDQRELIDDVLHFVNASLREARKSEVMEFPATAQSYSLSSSPSAHLDPATCELVD